MNATLPRHPTDVQTDEITPPVRMVMVYEDGDAGRRAKRFADEVLHGAGGDYRGTANFWNFDALASPEVRAAAANAAASADFVILAASGERQLSPEVDEWLGAWSWMIGEKNPALVALFDESKSRCVRSIRSDLGVIAKRKHLEFVAFHCRSEPSPDEGGGD